MKEFIREACVEGFDQALKAQLLGADRIELCARLDLDGLTPNKETIVQAVSQLTIPIRVMVRLRGGDFHYSSEEIKQMLETIRFCRTLGVEGVVFGTLNHENEVDLALTNQLVEAAGSLKTVFHRAIESTSDIARSVDLLNKETNISAILVSGTGGGKASDHVPELQDLIHCFGERELVVCGKLTDQNVEQLHQEIGAKAYHGKLIVGNLI